MSICASLGQEISQGKVDHTYKEYMKVNNIINDAGEFILHFEEKGIGIVTGKHKYSLFFSLI